MAKKWMKGVVKRPGAFRAKARAAGVSTEVLANRVTPPGSEASTRTKLQGNLAKTFAKYRGK